MHGRRSWLRGSSFRTCAFLRTVRGAVPRRRGATGDVARYLDAGNWKLVAEYVETESGKRADWPKQRAALSRAKAIGATAISMSMIRTSRRRPGSSSSDSGLTFDPSYLCMVRCSTVLTPRRWRSVHPAPRNPPMKPRGSLLFDFYRLMSVL